MQDRETVFHREEIWIGVVETPDKRSDSGTLLNTARPSGKQLHSFWWPGRRSCTCQLTSEELVGGSEAPVEDFNLLDTSGGLHL